MGPGFRIEHIDLLRCPVDAGNLGIIAAAPNDGGTRIAFGEVECDRCDRRWEIVDGILIFMRSEDLDEESRHEQRQRDRHARAADTTASTDQDSPESLLEIPPTLGWAAPEPGLRILEMGCGAGRYTARLADSANALIAVDFSRNALQVAAGRLPEDAPVSLVQADVTSIAVAPGCFDTVLSTLVSNLPSGQHRAAMLRVAAEALNPLGRFVFSTHYYGLRARLHRIAREGRYENGGIYRRYFSASEIVRETRAVFDDVRSVPISIVLPFSRRLGLPLPPISRTAMRVPLLRQFGDLLLVEARSARKP